MSAPTPVVYLHIGAPKTGTTFLQQLMWANRENLLDAGYLFPGHRWRQQGLATREILGRTASVQDPEMRADVSGKWSQFTAEMLAFDGKASIFSMEFLSFARKPDVERIMSTLEGAEVHVVLGVRDATGAIPAQWQTRSRSGGKLAWSEFAREVVESGGRKAAPGAGDAPRTFQRGQGIPRILNAWGDAVPSDRLHVITVPPPGSDELLLWRRFAEVVGVDPAVAANEIGRANPSMGQASADLMRRLNAELGSIPISQYEETVAHRLAKTILAPRAALETRAEIDRTTMAFAARWNRRVRDAIVASGAHVVGDLEDLPVEIPAHLLESAPQAPEDPPDEEILEAAAAARDGMLAVIANRARRLKNFDSKARTRKVDKLFVDTPTDPKRWVKENEPVPSAVREIAKLVRVAIDLQNRLKVARAAAEGR